MKSRQHILLSLQLWPPFVTNFSFVEIRAFGQGPRVDLPAGVGVRIDHSTHTGYEADPAIGITRNGRV